MGKSLKWQGTPPPPHQHPKTGIHAICLFHMPMHDPPPPCLTEQVGFKYTGRKCSTAGCNAKLRDHVLDWEDALPADELRLSGGWVGGSVALVPACSKLAGTVEMISHA